MALGMVTATKYSGLIYAPLVLSMLLAGHVLQLVALRQKRLIQFGVKQFSYIMATAIAVPLPWYLRNIILWKNPPYPAEIRIAGVTVFDGPMSSDVLGAASYGWDIGPLITKANYFLEAFGLLIPMIALGVIWAGALLLRSNRRNWVLMSLGTLGALLFIAFIHQPYSVPASFDGFDYAFVLRYLMAWFTINLVVLAAVSSHCRFSPAIVDCRISGLLIC